jgi:hypothetical protein
MVARSERSRIARASDSWGLSGHDRRPLSATLVAVLADAPVDAEQLAAAVTRHGTGQPPAHVVAHPNHGFAVLGGVHALLSGLLFDDPPQETLARLVSHGADTDTVGAICGSVLGARFGTGWIAWTIWSMASGSAPGVTPSQGRRQRRRRRTASSTGNEN